MSDTPASDSSPVPSVKCDGGVCRIAGPIHFHTATKLLSEVDNLIRQHATLTIDLSGVSQCNSVGLALIIEWLAIARREKHSVTFNHIPDSLRQLAGVCQVDGLI